MIKIPVDYVVTESRRVNTALGQDSQCILLALPPIRSIYSLFCGAQFLQKTATGLFSEKTKEILYIFAVACPTPSSQGTGMHVCQCKN